MRRYSEPSSPTTALHKRSIHVSAAVFDISRVSSTASNAVPYPIVQNAAVTCRFKHSPSLPVASLFLMKYSSWFTMFVNIWWNIVQDTQYRRLNVSSSYVGMLLKYCRYSHAAASKWLRLMFCCFPGTDRPRPFFSLSVLLPYESSSLIRTYAAIFSMWSSSESMAAVGVHETALHFYNGNCKN